MSEKREADISFADQGGDVVRPEKGNVLAISAASRAATEQEHRLSVWQALTTYPKTVFWAMFLCLPIIGIQYDQVRRPPILGPENPTPHA